jgi:endonuclease/exonuclease/phosphatase family metal-dependent hydrolase
MLKTITKIVGGGILLFILYILVTLIHGTLTDFQPPAAEVIEVEQKAEKAIIQDSILSFAIWNIGYGGLGKESDFFMDANGSLFSGGHMVRPPRPIVEKNVDGVEQFTSFTKADFFLFQEVDYASKRSYGINQFDRLKTAQPGYAAVKATNFKVARVPIPVMEPWNVYGKTWSGLASLSAYQPVESKRIQLPGSFGWPKRIFQLDRCLAYQSFTVKGGKTLVVLNIHNSAYDEGGALKVQQMAFIKDLVESEYKKGHYVVVGGDWNMCPPFFPFDRFMPGKTQGYSQINIDSDFLPSNWKWVYDPTTPTNRKNKGIYKKGETFETLIDFFLVSPNIRVQSVKGIDQGFNYSDHQPVWMEVQLLD